VADNVGIARRAVVSYLKDAATPDPPLNDVGLAVSEAVTNVVHHAYVDAAEPGPVRVQVELSDEEVEVIVEDDGRGMLPRPDSPGLGLGLPLIATLADRFDTTTSSGTRICMWFRRNPGAATLPG
jgi:serine/threonine-protein kinase RsbW/stage II sporulation protein AB (anti-sigma F factor)